MCVCVCVHMYSIYVCCLPAFLCSCSLLELCCLKLWPGQLCRLVRLQRCLSRIFKCLLAAQSCSSTWQYIWKRAIFVQFPEGVCFFIFGIHSSARCCVEAAAGSWWPWIWLISVHCSKGTAATWSVTGWTNTKYTCRSAEYGFRCLRSNSSPKTEIYFIYSCRTLFLCHVHNEYFIHLCWLSAVEVRLKDAINSIKINNLTKCLSSSFVCLFVL